MRLLMPVVQRGLVGAGEMTLDWVARRTKERDPLVAQMVAELARLLDAEAGEVESALRRINGMMANNGGK
jgi:hypothetical protein